MKIELEINDILSREEIEERAKEIFVDILKSKISQDSDRMLSNAAYYCAYQIMDGLITEDQKKFIQTKTLSVIEKMGSSDVFRAENHWREKPSIAYMEIERAVSDNKEKIINNTISVIENFDYESHLSHDCLGILEGAIIKKLQAKEK